MYVFSQVHSLSIMVAYNRCLQISFIVVQLLFIVSVVYSDRDIALMLCRSVGVL